MRLVELLGLQVVYDINDFATTADTLQEYSSVERLPDPAPEFRPYAVAGCLMAPLAGFFRLATVCAPNFLVNRSTRPSVSMPVRPRGMRRAVAASSCSLG